jgi:Histidine phosphatase superfamily (branch 1)
MHGCKRSGILSPPSRDRLHTIIHICSHARSFLRPGIMGAAQHDPHQFFDKMPEVCNGRVPHDVMAAQIYLIRHGETKWSLSGQHTGRTDLPLTEHGELQAHHIGKLLSGTTFSQVLVSPVQRARRACELAGCGAAARVEPNLSEWNYGDYEGRTPADIRAQRPRWDNSGWRPGWRVGRSSIRARSTGIPQ